MKPSSRIEVHITGDGEKIVSLYENGRKDQFRNGTARVVEKEFLKRKGCKSSHNGYFVP